MVLRMPRMFDKWIPAGVIAFAGLLLIDATITFRNTVRLHNDSFRVYHTHETIADLDDLLLALTDAETGQRGFIITGDERYLEPYRSALARVAHETDELELLTRDNPTHQAQFPQLRDMIRGKLEELGMTIELQRTSGPAASRAEVMTHLGKNRMDTIRAVVAAMKATELDLLRQRTQISEQTYRTAIVSGLIGALAALLGLFGFAWAMRRHLRGRREGAARIEEQRRWLHTTLASIGDAVIATDAKGRITFLNPIAERLTGWSSHEAERMPLVDVFNIVNEQTRRPAEDPAGRALASGTIVGLANHTVLISKDGSERPIDDSAAPIRDAEGQIIGVVLVFRDVTERRRTERALLETDRRKDEFLAMLSHELRNPLAPIRNAVQILESDDARGAEGVWARDVISRQVKHMSRVVDDLLDMSRISANKLQIQREDVELAGIVDSAVETSRPLIDEARHRLTIRVPSEPIHLDADPIRLSQVISNLLNNAAHYTKPGGAIALTVEREGSDAIISVKDNGIGISAEMLPRVFEVFAQGTSPEPAQSGLGIGLSLARALVTLHGGHIEARSDGIGRGSEFLVRLPITSPGERRPPPETAPSGAGLGKSGVRHRVLIADDLRDAADSLAVLLRLSGHDVETAYDGEEALAKAERVRPDVALLDIGMPKLNGYDVARRIRSAPWGEHMLLVALTGWGQATDRRRTAEAGFNQHMTKPVDLADLHKVLTAIEASGS
jgi:PAS domain S-box-containing protein